MHTRRARLAAGLSCLLVLTTVQAWLEQTDFPQLQERQQGQLSPYSSRAQPGPRCLKGHRAGCLNSTRRHVTEQQQQPKPQPQQRRQPQVHGAGSVQQRRLRQAQCASIAGCLACRQERFVPSSSAWVCTACQAPAYTPIRGLCGCSPGYGNVLQQQACMRCTGNTASQGGPMALTYCRPCGGQPAINNNTACLGAPAPPPVVRSPPPPPSTGPPPPSVNITLGGCPSDQRPAQVVTFNAADAVTITLVPDTGGGGDPGDGEPSSTNGSSSRSSNRSSATSTTPEPRKALVGAVPPPPPGIPVPAAAGADLAAAPVQRQAPVPAPPSTTVGEATLGLTSRIGTTTTSSSSSSSSTSTAALSSVDVAAVGRQLQQGGGGFDTPTQPLTWPVDSAVTRGWEATGVSSALFVNPAVAASSSEVLHLMSGSLQAFSIASDTGLDQDSITDVLPLSTLAAAANPPGGAATYQYIDPSAQLDAETNTWVFTFASAPAASSSIAAQTYHWYLGASTAGDIGGDYTLFRFDPTLPSSEPAACPAGQKTGMTQTRVTTDALGMYVTGVLVCYDPTSRAATFATSVLYVLPGTVVESTTLSRFAVFTSSSFIAAMPPQLAAAATAAWFPQLQPAKLQYDTSAAASTTAVFVAQHGTAAGFLILLQLSNLAAGLPSGDIAPIANQPILRANVIAKSSTLAGSVLAPRVVVPQPGGGPAINPGPYNFITGAGLANGIIHVAKTELNAGINSIFWGMYEITNTQLCFNQTRTWATGVVAASGGYHLTVPTLQVTPSSPGTRTVMHIVSGVASSGTYPTRNGAAAPAYPGVAYVAVQQPPVFGASAAVGNLTMREFGKAALRTGTTTSPLPLSTYSSAALVPVEGDDTQFDMYYAVAYAGTAPAASQNVRTFLGYLPFFDQELRS